MVADMGTVYPVRLPCRSSTTNSSTGSLRLAVAMATGDWNATHVHVVSGMDVATQEACSAHYDGEGALVITMCCLPVAIIIKPCDTCGDSDDDRRRRLGVDAYVGASSSPSPSECALRSAHPKFPACACALYLALYYTVVCRRMLVFLIMRMDAQWSLGQCAVCRGLRVLWCSPRFRSNVDSDAA